MSVALAGWRTTAEAEHSAAARITDEIAVAATHFAPNEPRVLVTLEDRDGHVVVLGASGAAEEDEVRARHERRSSGRLFRFGGSRGLTGRITVARLLEASAVDEVRLVGSPDPVDGSAVVDTQDFVRPTMHDGVVRLVLRPAADEVLVPFEQPDPTPCCADH